MAINVDNVKAQMRKGILEYCILSILSREDSYAPKIISLLKESEMIVVEGTLYPILTRQKNQGLLTYRWEESPQGPPRKYYMITQAGRDALSQLDCSWEQLVSQIRRIRYGEESAPHPAPAAGPAGPAGPAAPQSGENGESGTSNDNSCETKTE